MGCNLGPWGHGVDHSMDGHTVWPPHHGHVLPWAPPALEAAAPKGHEGRVVPKLVRFFQTQPGHFFVLFLK